MKNSLIEFLKSSYTAYHACENVKNILLENGFRRLPEGHDWPICEDGKYFVERNGSSIIAFTVGALDDFSYKIAASHTDSPALKLKENPLISSSAYVTLNVEKYGGGLWYSFLDRPLKIAGRVIRKEDGLLRSETVESPFLVTIPSLAIHQNRTANEGFAINPQIDLQPLYALSGEGISLDAVYGENAESEVISYDLYLVNADMPYSFGVNDEFLASPRIDNLTSVYASLQALLSHGESTGICVAAFFDNEEVGNLTQQGADGDFLENTLKRIAYALRFDDNEYYKALASSFMLSVDNAHALHPNHPEKCDPTNRPTLGGGVVIKAHADKAYTTDAFSSAIVKTVFDNAEVRYQKFFNRSDVRSGGTLGAATLRHVGVRSVDIGVAQLAMHSACESFAIADFEEMVKGVTAFYKCEISVNEEGVIVR
ncbi:MAG: M18 family aminopeptidase [Clostridia bacterium]|nr:M18 family aminopeptidase [Clostridia bacterium]